MIKILMFRPKEKFEEIKLENVEIENVPLTEIIFNKIDENNIKKNYDYVIFTSSVAVESLKSQVSDFDRILENKEIIAIGEKTASMIGKKVTVPELQSSVGILKTIKPNKNVLLIRSENGNPYLVKQLSKISKNLDVINAYKSVVIKKDFSEVYNKLKNGYYNAVIFTSSMIFNSYIDIFSEYGNPLEILPKIIIAIGEETSKAMRKLNITPVIMDKPDVILCVNKVLELIKKFNLN